MMMVSKDKDMVMELMTLMVEMVEDQLLIVVKKV